MQFHTSLLCTKVCKMVGASFICFAVHHQFSFGTNIQAAKNMWMWRTALYEWIACCCAGKPANVELILYRRRFLVVHHKHELITAFQSCARVTRTTLDVTNWTIHVTREAFLSTDNVHTPDLDPRSLFPSRDHFSGMLLGSKTLHQSSQTLGSNSLEKQDLKAEASWW